MALLYHIYTQKADAVARLYSNIVLVLFNTNIRRMKLFQGYMHVHIQRKEDLYKCL